MICSALAMQLSSQNVKTFPKSAIATEDLTTYISGGYGSTEDQALS